MKIGKKEALTIAANKLYDASKEILAALCVCSASWTGGPHAASCSGEIRARRFEEYANAARKIAKEDSSLPSHAFRAIKSAYRVVRNGLTIWRLGAFVVHLLT